MKQETPPLTRDPRSCGAGPLAAWSLPARRLLLGLLLLAITGWFPASGHSALLDGIAAVVEGEIITMSEVNDVAIPVLARLRESGSQADPAKVRERALEELIIRKLRNRKAAQLGIEVDDADINRLMVRLAEKNRVTLDLFLGALQQRGVDLVEYRERLRQQTIQGRLVDQVIRPLVHVSPEEAADLFRNISGAERPTEEVRVGQILLQTHEGMSPGEIDALRVKAESIAQQLRGGADLGALASQYSDDPSGLRGGDMGWFKRGQMPSQIEGVVFGLAAGQVSEPLKSAQGFHILMVQERRTADQSALAASQEQIKARHILIKTALDASPEAAAQARATVEAIAHQLRQGDGDAAQFAALAEEYSEDGSAGAGGSLDWFGRGVMVPAFEEVAFALEPGQISQPVRTPFGWHLILVEDHRSVSSASFEAQREELTQRLREAKIEARYKQWLRDLRLRAFVEIR